MFYSQFILAKKGPLGTIWIAAHLERKLRKNQVADTDIGVSVDSILFPEMPIALRLSSHLLLGVVRIYSKKVNYLFDDCSEALLKVKQAFRSTAVDLPPEESTAPYHAITLPETFDLDDFELPDNELFQSNYVDHHISSKDQITLQDTMEGVVFSTSKFGLDERFGDGDASGLDLDEELLVEKAASAEYAAATSNSDVDPQASAQANESRKYEDNRDSLIVHEMPAGAIINQHNEEYDGDNEPIDYAQAPCTPGLWEEPNLSNIQETSACDDHQEPEIRSIKEFAVNENFENISSKEAECVPHEQHHNQSEPHIAATEQILMDDLGSTPFTEFLLASHVRSMSPIAEASETVIDVSNKNARDEERGVQTVDDNENCVEHQGNQENTKTFDYFQGEGPHATEASERNFPETHLAELDLNDEEVQVASSISNSQVENSIVQVDNINSYTTDFPAPEKLLSIPPGFADIPKNLVPESTPAEKDMSNITSGKKRSFTESSLTAQSLHSDEASGFFTTNMTGESALNDDDLLSSILVGRKSSILKMKPTPVDAPPSTKRRRSAPKTGISKRKVLMDENMVLHGDTIRQQLTNTEDIRRLRKKAPCTPSEISLIEKQFWEDELFTEAIFTGLSIKMASLHNQSYDLSKIKIVVSHSDTSVEGRTDPKSISLNDEKDIQLENVHKENEGEFNFHPVTGKEVLEAEPIEFPLVTDNHTIRDVTAEPFSSEHEILGKGIEMEIDAKKTFSDADVGVSVVPIDVESLTHANVVPSDTYELSAPMGEAEMTGQMDMSSNKPFESSVASEIKIDVSSVTEISEEKHELLANASTTFYSETDGLRSHIGTLEEDMETRNNDIYGEEFVSTVAYDAEGLDERENPGHHVTFQTTEMYVEDIPANNRVDDDEEFKYSAVGNDTDFLNFDDVDDDEAGDYMPDEGATRVIDNSGWSSRTKAVAKYLQIMFDKEGELGRTMLPVNNLLAGKTRKEASRMFFETLVLKTKDYIHVEQADPYENINVFPRAKLLKSDF